MNQITFLDERLAQFTKYVNDTLEVLCSKPNISAADPEQFAFLERLTEKRFDVQNYGFWERIAGNKILTNSIREAHLANRIFSIRNSYESMVNNENEIVTQRFLDTGWEQTTGWLNRNVYAAKSPAHYLLEITTSILREHQRMRSELLKEPAIKSSKSKDAKSLRNGNRNRVEEVKNLKDLFTKVIYFENKDSFYEILRVERLLDDKNKWIGNKAASRLFYDKMIDEEVFRYGPPVSQVEKIFALEFNEFPSSSFLVKVSKSKNLADKFDDLSAQIKKVKDRIDTSTQGKE